MRRHAKMIVVCVPLFAIAVAGIVVGCLIDGLTAVNEKLQDWFDEIYNGK